MSRSAAELQAIHRYSSQHRGLLDASAYAGCFFCLAEFPPAQVTVWVDVALEATSYGGLTEPRSDGVTALCPHCGIDSVLPSAAPIALDPSLLAEMQAFWFR